MTACEIEDDLVIREDGSGTYRARITVPGIAGHVLDRIQAEAERKGYRVIDKGSFVAERYIVIQKDFADISSLSDSQANFTLAIDTTTRLRRRYHLRITVAAVTTARFQRRFTITLPGNVISTTAGAENGQRVTWFCENGGTIDIKAEKTLVPPLSMQILLLMAGGVASAIVILIMRSRRKAYRAPLTMSGRTCTTCGQALAADARYCAGCGDRVLPG